MPMTSSGSTVSFHRHKVVGKYLQYTATPTLDFDYKQIFDKTKNIYIMKAECSKNLYYYQENGSTITFG